MPFKLVWLWTDLALWALIATVSLYAFSVWRHPDRRATWRVALRDGGTLAAGAVLALFMLVTALDSVHFRRALPAAPGQAADTTYYDTRTESLLDLVLARPLAMRESSYSRPLVTHGLLKQNIERNGATVREFPRLTHGGAHLEDARGR